VLCKIKDGLLLKYSSFPGVAFFCAGDFIPRPFKVFISWPMYALYLLFSILNIWPPALQDMGAGENSSKKEIWSSMRVFLGMEVSAKTHGKLGYSEYNNGLISVSKKIDCTLHDHLLKTMGCSPFPNN
jgi:hypothetical protein